MDYQSYYACKAYQHAEETLNVPHQMVLIYTQAIASMQQAKDAIGAKDYAQRHRLIEKVMVIMQSLRASVDEAHNSKALVTMLDEYHQTIDSLLLAVQLTNDLHKCDEIIRLLSRMQCAWHQLLQNIS